MTAIGVPLGFVVFLAFGFGLLSGLGVGVLAAIMMPGGLLSRSSSGVE